MKQLVMFVLCVLCAISASWSGGEANTRHTPVVVMLDRSCETGLSVTINSEPVTFEASLDVFADLVTERGRELSVVILAHERTPIADLTGMRALAHKAGFLHVRFFYFDDDRRMMAEITMDKAAVPFTGSAPPS